MGPKSDYGNETAYNRGTILSNKTDRSDPFNNIPGLPYGQPQGFMAAQSPHGSAFNNQQDLSNIGNNYTHEANYPTAQPSPPPQNVATTGPSPAQDRYPSFGDARSFFSLL